MLGADCGIDPGLLEMIDMLTIEQTLRTSWGKARRHAGDAALWSTDHPYIAWGLVYGMVAYFGSAVLIGVPGRALIALVVVGPTSWWCFGRYQSMMSAQASKLGFFTGENGPLRLSEDILSPKIVYCIGLRNEGKKAVANARVTIDGINGQPQTPAAPLPVFRNPADNAGLQPGESEYFCVMRIVDGAKEDDGTVALCCPDGQADLRCGLRELQGGATITLTASGDGASHLTQRIRIASKRGTVGWSLDLTLLPDADEAPMPLIEPSPAAPPPVTNSDQGLVAAIEQSPVAEPPLPEVAAVPTQAPQPSSAAPQAMPDAETISPPIAEQPAVAQPQQEPSAHSDRIRRLLARQGRA